MSDIERADDLIERYWDELLEIEPILGTSVGDERYDDRLNDPSEAGRARALDVHRGALTEAATIDRDALDEPRRTSLDVLEAIAERYATEIERRTDMLAVANHLFGPGQLPGALASLQRADSLERLDRYEARLRAIPAFLAASEEVAREGIDAGITTPRVLAERVVAQLERLLALAPEDSPLLAPAGEDHAGRDRILEVNREIVGPAYERFLDAMRDYLPHATETIGLSALPGGPSLYEAEILAWTTLPLDAVDVHALGNERFEAIQEERAAIAADLGFGSAREAVEARRRAGRTARPRPRRW